MGGRGWSRVALTLLVVIGGLLGAVLGGCRGPGSAPAGPPLSTPESSSGSQPGTGPAAGSVDLPDLLWSWPSVTEARGEPGAHFAACFRFVSPPPPGSLSVEVEPAAPYVLTYAGQMATVTLDYLSAPIHEVVLAASRSGRRIASAYLAAASNAKLPLPRVTVGEGRDRFFPDGGYIGRGGYHSPPLEDGATVEVGFGDVCVDILVPTTVTEEALRAACRVEPESSARFAFTPNWCEVNVLQVRWPGVAASASALPDPVRLVAGGEAPDGFALVMKLSIDAARIPGFTYLTRDGSFDVRVQRKTPPDVTVRSLDQADVGLPYPGYRTVFSLPLRAHRFRFTFTKVMDRASVERRLVLRGGQALAWTFTWNDDRTLDVMVTPLGGGPAEAVLCPEKALDTEGLPIWLTETLVVRWAQPHEVLRLAAAGARGAEIGEQVLVTPPGVTPVAWSPGGSFLIGLERTYLLEEGDSPGRYHPWLYRSADGRWVDLATAVRPVSGVLWLGESRLLLDRGHHWEVLDAVTGQGGGELDFTGDDGWCRGLCVSPDGAKVAALVVGKDESDVMSLDVVVFDASGRVLERWPGVTSLVRSDNYCARIPLAWLPGEDAVVLPDRPPDPGPRLLRVDLATGQTRSIPGEADVNPTQPEAFTVFRRSSGPGATGPATALGATGSRVLCGFVTYWTDEQRGELRVVDMTRGAPVLTLPVDQRGVPALVERCLPSPNGSYLAVTGYGRTLLLDLTARTPATGDAGPVVAGTALGWSPDGQWLYLLAPATEESGRR